jgi:hypothetical protein
MYSGLAQNSSPFRANGLFPSSPLTLNPHPTPVPEGHGIQVILEVDTWTQYIQARRPPVRQADLTLALHQLDRIHQALPILCGQADRHPTR